jgi:hypothetical protein
MCVGHKVSFQTKDTRMTKAHYSMKFLFYVCVGHKGSFQTQKYDLTSPLG